MQVGLSAYLRMPSVFRRLGRAGVHHQSIRVPIGWKDPNAIPFEVTGSVTFGWLRDRSCWPSGYSRALALTPLEKAEGSFSTNPPQFEEETLSRQSQNGRRCSLFRRIKYNMKVSNIGEFQCLGDIT